MSNPAFKVGDWVQLRTPIRIAVHANYTHAPDLQKVFLEKMQIISLFSSPLYPGITAKFIYPPGCQFAGHEYNWPCNELELVPSLVSSNCSCPLGLLLNRGCQCGAFKAEQKS